MRASTGTSLSNYPTAVDMAVDLGTASMVGTSVRVILDPIALNFLLKSPSGLVGRLILSIAQKTVVVAKANAPVKTGMLRSTISIVDFKPTLEGMQAKVAVNVSYAQAVHFGVAGGRTIRAKGGKVLKFPSNGGFVYRRQVTQGRTTPNPFFWRALMEVMVTDPRVVVLSSTFDPGIPL